MKVELVALTVPVARLQELGIRTADDLLVYEARVSSPSNQTNTLTGPKLLAYCIEHGHWSVFDQADMTLEIETSRAIAAQILRHHSFRFQEFSQRYAKADMGYERYVARRQDVKNRQNSLDDLPSETKDWFDRAQHAVEDFVEDVYKAALDHGVAKEQARMVLPLSTRTRMYMKGSVRSWIHYLKARTHESAQKEHRDVAAEIRVVFIDQFPSVAEAVWPVKVVEAVEDLKVILLVDPRRCKYCLATEDKLVVGHDGYCSEYCRQAGGNT